MSTQVHKREIAKFRARMWRKWDRQKRLRTLRERRGGILCWLRRLLRFPMRTR